MRELCVVTDREDIIGLYPTEDEACRDFMDLSDIADTSVKVCNTTQTATANNGETKFLRIIINDKMEKARLTGTSQQPSEA